jgi:hypothetical protein
MLFGAWLRYGQTTVSPLGVAKLRALQQELLLRGTHGTKWRNKCLHFVTMFACVYTQMLLLAYVR